MSVLDRLNNFVTVTKNAGINTSLDINDVNPPGALIIPDYLDTVTFAGYRGIAATVYLIARDNGWYQSLVDLDEAMTKMLDVIDRMDNVEIVDTDFDVSVTLPNPRVPLPAWAIKIAIL